MIKIKISATFSDQLKRVEQEILDAEKKKLLDNLKQTTPVDTGNAQRGWHIVGNQIRNDVEYISELNKGSSQQAPKFFVEQSVVSSPFKFKMI